MAKERGYYQDIVTGFFRNDSGESYQLTDGQADIFGVIYEPAITRVVVRAMTQFGKSEVSALALIMAAVSRREKILIVAPSQKQASIIMGYVIIHLFDHDYLKMMIEWEGSLERLKQERSKRRITFKNGSEIFILTADARTVSQEAKSLMGFSATLLVVDESALIPDQMFSKILRIVGSGKGRKLVQLGNPFASLHFQRAFESERYKKIIIDWKQALREKRVTQEFLDEAKENMPPMDWMIFYECKFPTMGAEDTLIPRAWIDGAVFQKNCGGDKTQAGLDVARFGSDKSIYIFRKGGEVKKIKDMEKMDTMEVVGWVRGLLEEDEPEILAVDVIGIGSGVYDRLSELGDEGEVEAELEPVNVGEAPTDEDAKEKFLNLRAQIFWNLRDFFKPGKDGQSKISIPDDAELKRQLSEIRYKYSSERKIKIEPKEEMKKRLGHSPDKADALALAFFDTSGVEPQMFIESV